MRCSLWIVDTIRLQANPLFSPRNGFRLMKRLLSWLAICSVGSFFGPADTAQSDTNQSPGPRSVAVNVEKYVRIRYVSQLTGSDSQGDGSKAKPWQTIVRALTQTADASADQRYAIFVAAGTYACDELTMRDNVDLFGGFEPAEWEREIFRHATILDGRGRRRILVGADHARLDGFIIRRGLVRGRGGALLCDGTSPTLTNNRFVSNRTEKPSNWNPEQLHELAHDGGAIFCLHGAKPTIAHNIFANNQTEVGRGGAIALHDRCEGKIVHNIFLDNETGTADEHRSSDGGAISVFDWSSPRIEQNILLENKAHNMNDGGAIFVALWSSPVITKNIFVGNRSTDDGGALFVGGQEHRYGKAKDPVPEKEDFCVEILGNLFLGNENGGLDSGGMRLTMEARVTLQNNIMARDARLYVQDSEVEITNNTILEDTFFRDMSHRSADSVVVNNILWGQLKLPRETSVAHCNVRDGYLGEGNISEEPRFIQDQDRFSIDSATYVPGEHSTEIRAPVRPLELDELANRVVRIDHRWGVVKSNQEDVISVWGDVSGEKELRVLPTFHLHPESPCIDKGTVENAPNRDIHGDSRPMGEAIDIGADEVTPVAPLTN